MKFFVLISLSATNGISCTIPVGAGMFFLRAFVIDPSSSQPRHSKKREIAVKTVLAQNNELAMKLRSVLEL